MSDIDKSVTRILETYASTVYAKDTQSFMRLYDPNVRVFDAWGVWSYQGAPAWQIAVEGWFTSLGSERVKVSFAEVQSLGGPDMAMVSAIVSYAALNAEGEKLREMHNRISWGLRTSKHMLRIAHEHTSAPIGFSDSKAILLRPAGA
jgi:ketosteroid isomerase-like protein